MTRNKGQKKTDSSDGKKALSDSIRGRIELDAHSVWTSVAPSRFREKFDELLGKTLSEEDKKRLEQLKKKCRKAVRDLESSTKSNKNVLVIFGNGVSEKGASDQHPNESVLSTADIHYAYLRDMASTNPRRYQERRQAIERLSEAFEERSGDYDMLGFMKDLAEVEDVKKGFVDYVIRICCTAKPNPNHSLILRLFYLLSGPGRVLRVVHFTTNYDNLVEKAYHSYGRVLFLLNYSRLEEEESGTKTKPASPVYVLDDDGIASSEFPIVPIHGSVRVCVCPQCGRILKTEAAAMGEKRCVYCGRDIPSVVLPTSEGEADKRLLRILEKKVSESAAMVFIGYGFGDPHIMERIRRGMTRAKGSESKTVINISHSVLKSKTINLAGKKLHNLTGDITEVLGTLVTVIEGGMSSAKAK